MLFVGKKIQCSLSFKNKKFNYELERHKTINDLLKRFLKDMPEINYPVAIRLIANKLPFKNKEYEKPLLSLNGDKFDHLFFEITKSFNCSLCTGQNSESKNDESSIEDNTNNNFITKYCLNCNKFLCNLCLQKQNPNHLEHYLIDINPAELKDSIKLWNIKLTADLAEQVTSFNKQKFFLNDKDLLQKINIWKTNIINKLNNFENLMKNLYERCSIVKKQFSQFDANYNKIMLNLSKNEQEMNNNFSINEKNSNKYFSFDEAEAEIHKLKKIFNEIQELKQNTKPIINITNINTYEKYFNEIPISFDELIKSILLMLENIKIYENSNKQNSFAVIYKYPDYMNKDVLRNLTITNSKNRSKYNSIFTSNLINRKYKIHQNKNNYIKGDIDILSKVAISNGIINTVVDNKNNDRSFSNNSNNNIEKKMKNNINSFSSIVNNNDNILSKKDIKLNKRNEILKKSMSTTNNKNQGIILPKINNDKENEKAKKKANKSPKENKIPNQLLKLIDNKSNKLFKVN